jgi:ribosomal 50S subunit-recycling heat shock protein
VNDKTARASYEVKVGDIIEITMGERRVRVEVLSVQEHATKDNASLLYRVLS